MKICDVVLNSVWFDPRVRKQIIAYKFNNDEVTAIGLKCARYDKDKISNMPCKTIIAQIDERFSGRQKNIWGKLKRKQLQEKSIIEAIISEKPDIIHANDMNALIPAYKAAKKLNCRLIYDAHEIFWANFWDGKHKLYSIYLKIQEMFLCKKVDNIVCVSNAAATYFEKEYNIKRPLVITNCSLISEQCFTCEKHEGFEVLNQGMFYSGRGYDIMVEAIPYLRSYPEIKLAIRGFGSMETSLRQRASELGDENFKFYPKVLVEELIPMAAKSHVGIAITEPICLNFELSVSNKIFEYASAGLPVIMSNIPEHRFLNEKYNFGVIINDNKPETLSKAIIKLYEDKDYYDKCAANSRRLSNEINWENEFQKLIDFERSIITNY